MAIGTMGGCTPYGAAHRATHRVWTSRIRFRSTEVGGARTVIARIDDGAPTANYWAVREEAGEVICETSVDGMSWTERGRGALAFDLTAVRVRLGAGRGVDLPGDHGAAEFDNLNLVP